MSEEKKEGSCGCCHDHKHKEEGSCCSSGKCGRSMCCPPCVFLWAIVAIVLVGMYFFR